MQTITVPKTEYKKILDNQRELQTQVFDLQEMISRVYKYEHYKAPKLLPSAIKRIEKARKDIKSGKGIVVNSKKGIKDFFDNL